MMSALLLMPLLSALSAPDASILKERALQWHEFSHSYVAEYVVREYKLTGQAEWRGEQPWKSMHCRYVSHPDGTKLTIEDESGSKTYVNSEGRWGHLFSQNGSDGRRYGSGFIEEKIEPFPYKMTLRPNHILGFFEGETLDTVLASGESVVFEVEAGYMLIHRNESLNWAVDITFDDESLEPRRIDWCWRPSFDRLLTIANETGLPIPRIREIWRSYVISATDEVEGDKYPVQGHVISWKLNEEQLQLPYPNADAYIAAVAASEPFAVKAREYELLSFSLDPPAPHLELPAGAKITNRATGEKFVVPHPVRSAVRPVAIVLAACAFLFLIVWGGRRWSRPVKQQ